MKIREMIHKWICRKRTFIFVVMQCDRCRAIRADGVAPEGGRCDHIIEPHHTVCNGRWGKIGGVAVTV